jgi:hypothetical protein
MELCTHSVIPLHGVVLNYLSTGTILPLSYGSYKYTVIQVLFVLPSTQQFSSSLLIILYSRVLEIEINGHGDPLR